METVVDRNGGSFTQTKFNSRFLSYANDAGFKPIACRPFRPQPKGCVEALARTMDRLKPYDGEFETLEELTGIVNELRKDLNDEVSQASGKTPNELISVEKEYLASLPQGLERYYVKVQQRKVSKDSMVKFRKHQYSVNPKYIGKTVEIKETSDQICNDVLTLARCLRAFKQSFKQVSVQKAQWTKKHGGAYPKNIKDIDNNHLIQTLNTLTTNKNLNHVLNAANPKFAKYSNSPIEGINRKIKLLRRLSFSIPNFTNMKKHIIL